MRKWMALVVGMFALVAVASGVSCTVTITSGSTGGGEVLIEPAGVVCQVQGVDISPDCFYEVAPFEDEITLTATPAVNSTFGNWAGDCDSVNANVCVIRFDGIDDHPEVQVTFLLKIVCSTGDEEDGPVQSAC